jgi:hypothetical protein
VWKYYEDASEWRHSAKTGKYVYQFLYFTSYKPIRFDRLSLMPALQVLELTDFSENLLILSNLFIFVSENISLPLRLTRVLNMKSAY